VAIGVSRSTNGRRVLTSLATSGITVTRNALSNFVVQSFVALLAILCIPVTLHGLGAERFGILTLAWLVVGYSSVLDLGIARATARFVSTALAHGATVPVGSVLGTAITLSTSVGFLLGIGVALLGAVLIQTVTVLREVSAQDGLLSVIATASAIPIVVLGATVRASLEAGQRFGLVNAVAAPANASIYVVPAAGSLMGLPLPLILAGLVLVRLCALLAYFGLNRRTYGAAATKYAFDLGVARSLLRFGGWVVTTSVVGTILASADRFVIASLISVAAVSYFSVPYDVVTRVWILPGALIATLLPALSALRAQTDDERLAFMYQRSLAALSLIVLPICVGLILIAPIGLTVWLGGEFASHSVSIFQIFGVGVFFGAVAHIPFAFLQATGRPDLVGKLHLLEVVPYVATMALMSWLFGLVGTAAAWTLRASVDAGLLLLLAHRRVAAHRLGLSSASRA